MDSRVRSLATLVVLGAVLLVAALWGWSAISEPFPEEAEGAGLRRREFAKGDRSPAATSPSASSTPGPGWGWRG